jgi:tRNA(Ile)-lysidine synthase
MKRKAGGWGSEFLAALPNDRRYLIGVSGGRDSVALLHWLLDQGYRKLIVCHFEHGLRGRAGKSDARFVERLARKHGLEFELGSADIALLAARLKQSIETTARHERLAFFERVGRRRRCLTIFLAHQANDQVETFLLNLFRGAGGRGLGAMRARSIFGSLEIARPLLGVWRSEIDQYVKVHRLKFREDATNSELIAQRNRMRHRIIPYLEKQFGRQIRTSIWRTAMIAAEEDVFFEALFPPELSGTFSLSATALRDLPIAAQRRFLHKWLRGREVAEVGFELVERVRALLDTANRVAKTNLPGNRHVRRRAGRIFLE